MHEIHLVELAVLCIQEVHVLARADDAELLGHTGGFLHTAVAHDRVMEPGPDGRRCHHQNVGLFGAPAVHALGLEDQPFHTRADAGGIGVEPLFDVVGTQHDDEQIDDFMALEERISHAQSVH